VSCRDRDGRFTLEELLAFASFAHSYARLHHTLDSSYMAAGLASLRMWRDLREDSGRGQFVDWCVQLDTQLSACSCVACDRSAGDVGVLGALFDVWQVLLPAVLCRASTKVHLASAARRIRRLKSVLKGMKWAAPMLPAS
jgi:hypothetical protein